MNQLKSLDELAGKTVVKAVQIDANIFILFGDPCVAKCVAKFTAVRDFDDNCVEIDDGPIEPDELLRLGVISDAEYGELRRQQRDEDQVRETARQRALYEELKRKFENQ